MIVEIYGIDESDFKCSGCIFAKNIFDEHSIKYEFKRIIKKVNGNPEYDKSLLSELAKRVKFTTLLLPYIFIDNTLVKISNLKDFMISKGYDIY